MTGITTQLSITAALMCLSLNAVTYAQLTPATVNAQDINSIAYDDKLVQGVLDNGLSYMVRPTAEPKDRVSVRLYVAGGSLDETAETSGIFHFLEHLMFNGSRHYKRGELIPAMQKMGLAFGSDVNAYTGLKQTVYMMDLPNTKPETLDFAMTILRDYADGATLTEEAIDKERGIIVSELKARDSESYRAQIASLDQMLKNTRVTSFMPIGSEKVIKEAPYESFRKIYRDFYTADRMTVIITGDIAADKAEALIKKYFGKMPATKGAKRGEIGKADLTPSVRIIPNSESALTSMAFAVSEHWKHMPDTQAQRVADFPLNLAMAMLNLRLDRMTRDADCPFVGASFSEGGLLDTIDIFSGNVSAKPELWQKALMAVENELRRACQHGFQAPEIKEAIDSMRTGYESSMERWPSVSASAMATSLIASIDGRTRPSTPAEAKRIFEIAAARVLANPQLCQEALIKASDMKRAKLTMSGKIPEGVTEAAFKATFDAAAHVTVNAPDKMEELSFAYDKVGEPGKIVKQAEIADQGITTLTLSNNIKVNLKPLHFTKGVISVAALVDGGNWQLPQVPGLNAMIQSVMGAGGLQAHSIEDMERIFASKNVGVSFGLANDRISIAGNTRMEDLEDQFKIIAASILHAGYRPEGEALLRRILPATYQQLKTKPEGVMGIEGMPLIYGADPRFILPTQEAIEAQNTAKVKEALEPLLKQGAMEVSIVGDFKVEEVLPLLERTIGAMPTRAAEFKPVTAETRKAQLAPSGMNKPNFLRYDTKLDKTLVTQIRPVGDGRDKKRNRRLNVLNAIVRDRLFDGVRAALGETYSPSVRLNGNGDYEGIAYMNASNSGVKRNRALVNAAMDCIFIELGKNGITPDEFARAITPVRSSIDKQLRNNAYWMGRISKLQSDTQALEMLRNYKSDINSITYEEINALAKEVFGKNEALYIFVVPQDYKDGDDGPVNQEELDKKLKDALAPKAQKKTEVAAPAPAPAPVVAAPQAAEAKEASKPQNATADKGSYLVLISQETAAKPEWKAVADTLMKKYPQTKLAVVDKVENCEQAMRDNGARYAAIVARPEEVDYKVINSIHRAARKVDADIWGDCMWGIITGYTAADAQRIAADTTPLNVQRSLSTTNVDPSRFDYSCAITDWEPYQIFEQSGNTKPTETIYKADSHHGRAMQIAGTQVKFADVLETKKPQIITTSAHATEFNLEMPFGKGLIFPFGNRFYQTSPGPQQQSFVQSVLSPALAGNYGPLESAAKTLSSTQIKPDGQTRVWIAAGNCLFGNPRRSKESMAITALSGYTCNQVVGYTVPSWYGDGGWGTLSLYFSNTPETNLGQAWYLNNQFLLHKTKGIHPALLKVEFNDERLNNFGPLANAMKEQGVDVSKLGKDHIGTVHDRDVVAFFGDPMWQSQIDQSHVSAPVKIEWQGADKVKVTALNDHKGRAALWYPERKALAEVENEQVTISNDFMLLHKLELKKGESCTVDLLTGQISK